MSDIENSGDDTIAVAKKNGSIALKENNVTKNVTKTNDEKVDADMEDHDTSDKLNGSAASPKKVSDKDRSIMNGEGNGVSDAEDSITNGKWTEDCETSHPATDDDSVLEATPTPSSRNSPRKTLNDEYRLVEEMFKTQNLLWVYKESLLNVVLKFGSSQLKIRSSQIKI